MGLIHETIGWDAKENPFYLGIYKNVSHIVSYGPEKLYFEEDKGTLHAVKTVIPVIVHGSGLIFVRRNRCIPHTVRTKVRIVILGVVTVIDNRFFYFQLVERRIATWYAKYLGARPICKQRHHHK